MILAVDIGNSNICFALFEDHYVSEASVEPLFLERIHTNYEKTVSEYSADIDVILELYHIDRTAIHRVILSSVVAPLIPTMTETLENVFQKPVLLLNADLNLSFENHAKDRYAPGTDILADVEGAIHHFGFDKKPIVTIDMGTATVYTGISGIPALESIFITPGVRTSLNALRNGTALPPVSLEAPKTYVAKNTHDALHSGIIFGTAAIADGMISRLEKDLLSSCHVLATGGLAKYIVPYCKHPIDYDPMLLVKGLYFVALQNS